MSEIPIKIETYWNVNAATVTILLLVNSIKIETYWNVNWKGGLQYERGTKLK